MALQFVPLEQLQNWSIDNILQEAVLYNPQYTLMPLSELLTPEVYPIKINDDTYYQQVTMRSGGEGMEKRIGGYKQGRFIKTKSQNRLESGLLVISRIDARNGSFAIVPDELDGAIVTKDFPTFRINETRVRPQYLQLLLTAAPFTQLLEHGSKGTTNRQRVEISFLLNQQVAVPTLSEQDELLHQYKHTLAGIKENVQQVKSKTEERDHYFNTTLGLQDSESVPASQTTTGLVFISSETLANWNVETALRETQFESSEYPIKPLAELEDAIILLKRGESPRYSVQSKSIILNQKCVRWNYVDPSFGRPVDEVWAKRFTTESKTVVGDVLINSTGEGTIGRSAVVDAASSGKLHDSHVLLLRVNPTIANPTYLMIVINSPYGQMQIDRLKSAKTTKQTELGVANLLKLMIPMPPLSVQNEIASRIGTLNSEIKTLSDTEAIKAAARDEFATRIFKQ